MNVMMPDSTQTIARLNAALNAPNMPTREAESCALLLDRLTRPVRVGVFGMSSGGDAWLLDQLLGPGIVPDGSDWPTLEVVHGPQHITHATHEDGVTSSYEGRATPFILAEEPVFMRIEAPIDTLTRMRFLYLATDDAPVDQISALDWAEPRTDIAIWTTQVFDQDEIAIWARAPDGLKNHALLVSTKPGLDLAVLNARAGYEFDGVYSVPKGELDDMPLRMLLARLEEDIAEARSADLDAAHVFLHRLGHLVPEDVPAPEIKPVALDVPEVEGPAAPEPVAEPEPTPAPEPAPQPVAAPVAAAAPLTEKPVEVSPEMKAMLSEPILYLKRRARALLELVEWQAAEDADADWASEVLSHCCETTEGLQMRAMDWSEDEACALTLRRTLDEACDVAILLQVEGGRDQAQDAAMMLLQLRGDFERELAA